MSTAVHPTSHSAGTPAASSTGDRQLRTLRWAVRATLTLGVAASVAANVLHARPNPISQIIAAWPPLALLLTVELISRVPHHRWHLGAIRITAAAVIAAIAAWVSYWHLVGVAARYGETGYGTAYLLPISVDGLVIVASVSLVEISARIRVTSPPAAALDAAEQPTIPTATPAASPTGTLGAHNPVHASDKKASAEGRDAPRPFETVAVNNGVTPTPTHAPIPTPHTAVSPGPANSTGNGVPDKTTPSQLNSERQPRTSDPAPANGRPTGAPVETTGPTTETTGSRPPSGTADETGAAADAPRSRSTTNSESREQDEPSGGADTWLADTAAAVAYWRRRDPKLQPAEVAARIGRSERTVRRHWQPRAPTRAARVNGQSTGKRRR